MNNNSLVQDLEIAISTHTRMHIVLNLLLITIRAYRADSNSFYTPCFLFITAKTLRYLAVQQQPSMTPLS